MKYRSKSSATDYTHVVLPFETSLVIELFSLSDKISPYSIGTQNVKQNVGVKFMKVKSSLL